MGKVPLAKENKQLRFTTKMVLQKSFKFRNSGSDTHLPRVSILGLAPYRGKRQGRLSCSVACQRREEVFVGATLGTQTP